MLVHLISAPDMDIELKVKRCSEITWVHLSCYYTHLLNLRHISMQPSTVQPVHMSRSHVFKFLFTVTPL